MSGVRVWGRGDVCVSEQYVMCATNWTEQPFWPLFVRTHARSIWFCTDDDFCDGRVAEVYAGTTLDRSVSGGINTVGMVVYVIFSIPD